jgi:hypothetical protein
MRPLVNIPAAIAMIALMRRRSIRHGWRPSTASGSPSKSPRSQRSGHLALASIDPTRRS